MKKIIFTLTFAMIVFVGYSQKNEYKIKLSINGFKDSVCYLDEQYWNVYIVKDTAKFDSKGNLTFSSKKKLNEGVHLIVLPNKKYIQIFITDKPFFSITADSSLNPKSFKIKGSPENSRFYDYLSFISDCGLQLNEYNKSLANSKNKSDSVAIKKDIGLLNEKVMNKMDFLIKNYPNDLFSKMQKANKPIDIPETPTSADGTKNKYFPFYYNKAHYFDNIDFSDERLIYSDVYFNKVDNYFKNIVWQSADSIIKDGDWLIEKAKNNYEFFKCTVYYLCVNYELPKVMGHEAIYVHEVEKYIEPKLVSWGDSLQRAKQIERAKILKPLLLGKVAPALILQDTLGNQISNYEIKSKFLIQIFWDINCGHCQKDVPKLNDIISKMKKDGIDIEVLAVCQSYDIKGWKKFISEHNLSWINGVDLLPRYSLKEYYNIILTPTIYILNSKKEIIANRISVEQIEEFIKHELEK